MSKVSLALITVAAIVMVLASPAEAYWSGQGSGTGQAGTATLAAPTGVKGTIIADSVNLTWTAPVGLAPAGYYVTSVRSGVGAPACGTSPQALVTGLSCTDGGLNSGTYKYTVVAVLQSWTASSVPSSSLRVTGNKRLSVTQQPPATVQSGAKFGPVSIQLLDATGAVVKTGGVSITMKINSSTATLSGTLTAATDSSGVATFNNLSVNLAGTYTLAASTTGYVAATTESFTVTAAAPASIVVVSGSGQSAKSGSTYAQPFVVRVTDAAGNQVPGVTVNFTIQPNGSASGTIVGSSSPQTGSDGTASVTVQATGNSTGSPTLTATVANGGTPNLTVKFAMTTAPAAAQVAAAPALSNEPQPATSSSQAEPTTAPSSTRTPSQSAPSTAPSSAPNSPEPSSEPAGTTASAAPSGSPAPSGSAPPPSG